MKKIFSLTFAACTILISFSSCYKQDDIYKQYIVPGGYIYPAKAINLTAKPGDYRVVLEWDRPNDPSITHAKAYWDNYTDSMSVNYSAFKDGHVTLSVDKLEDRSYSFNIVNFDEDENRSLATEITTRPLGASWMITHSERLLVSCYMEKDVAVITLSKATDQMVGTKFRYVDVDGDWVNFQTILKPEENTIRIPRAMKGKKFMYTSGYYEPAAADTIWNQSWTKSGIGIPYPIPTKDWTVVATNNQTRSGFDAYKIFDGVTDSNDNKWFSSSSPEYRALFPKILSIDTHSEKGKEYTILHFDFYQNPTLKDYRYIRDMLIYGGDIAFDPNASMSEITKTFGEAAASASIPQNDAVYSVKLSSPTTKRYYSIVFKNSRNAANGYIDLYELVPYGYIESETE